MRNRFSRRFIPLGLVAALMLVGIETASTAPETRSAELHQTTRAVRRALERLPYYGVFDFLAFGLDRGTVTLEGYSYHPTLGADAVHAVKRVAGIDEVANKVEILPTSSQDDWIRWATFYRIYTDDFLSRYHSGGVVGARFAAYQFARFPGMQPSGRYPIHIIVKNGRVRLIGVVDNDSDKRLAWQRAREVIGTFAVENELVASKK